MHNNYLKTLGLPIGATKAEIKSAYRKLSKRYHPDVYKGEDAQERFIAIHEAYKFLMDVGPKPNNETITYNYDPFDAAYEDWRKKARAYAWKKAKEAQRQQQQQLSRLLKYFDVLALVILVFNLSLAIDYWLPRKMFEEEVVAVRKVYESGAGRFGNANNAYSYDDIYFENFYMRVDRGGALKLEGQDKAIVTTTYMFEIPLYALGSQNEESVVLEQVYGIYKVFGYIIPIIFLAWVFYKFVLINLDHKLTLSIFITMLFLVQLFLFFRF